MDRVKAKGCAGVEVKAEKFDNEPELLTIVYPSITTIILPS